jgi:hypothetical protein
VIDQVSLFGVETLNGFREMPGCQNGNPDEIPHILRLKRIAELNAMPAPESCQEIMTVVLCSF